MASPRVFISSTFYDLVQVRDDLQRFVEGFGYEAVRHERGAIPYGKDERLEAYAREEIDNCEIIVCIVGGRYGTESKDHPGSSITQTELRKAIARGANVFIFVDKGVHHECATYKLNKEIPEVKYQYDVRVHQFVEEIEALPNNNPLFPFETSADITFILREQWAGLFQRFLRAHRTETERRLFEDLGKSIETVGELIKFLTAKQSQEFEGAIRDILLQNHPAFRVLAEVTATPYRVFFTNRREYEAWLKARGWTKSPDEHLDPDSCEEWMHKDRQGYLKVTFPLFDANAQLVMVGPGEWPAGAITFEDADQNGEDDVPF